MKYGGGVLYRYFHRVAIQKGFRRRHCVSQNRVMYITLYESGDTGLYQMPNTTRFVFSSVRHPSHHPQEVIWPRLRPCLTTTNVHEKGAERSRTLEVG